MKIDGHTVEQLELLVPAAESTAIKGMILSGQVFGAFQKPQQKAIWRLLRGQNCLIPSLHTFFRDLWYLEACAHCVKRLVVVNKHQPTIRRAIRDIFRPSNHGDGECVIQTSETQFDRRSGTLGERADFAYRQVWLYAMRHYPRMAKESESGDLLAKASCEKADEEVLYRLAALARRLGYDSPRIAKLMEQSPDRQIARAALLKARKPDRYRYHNGMVESLIDRIVGCFAEAVPIEP